jgi:ABC-type phosphate/phosphonate transport system permease subunit
MASDLRSRIKQAELLSTVGAGVLGAGLALLLLRWLAPFAVLIAIVGLAAHVWGMFTKHRIESAENVQRAPWESFVYWACWLILAGLIAYIAATAFT